MMMLNRGRSPSPWLLLACVSILSACGGKKGGSNVPESDNPGPAIQPNGASVSMHLESTIPREQAAMFMADLDLIGHLELSDSPDLRKIMGLKSLSTQAVGGWLNDRVKYIIDEKSNLDDVDGVSLIAKPGQHFPQPDKLPPISAMALVIKKLKMSALNRELSPFSDSITLASNSGAGLYMTGKAADLKISDNGDITGSVYSLQIDNELVAVQSPRTGIMQIGAGHFHPFINKDVNALSNQIMRISTLLHEAHHSDGQGHSLGFAHIRCPKGHDLAGKFACDLAYNGPYTLDALFVKASLRACANCSAAEIEKLKLLAADSLGRYVQTSELPEIKQAIKQVGDLLEQKSTTDAVERKKLETLRGIYTSARDFFNQVEQNPKMFWDDGSENAN
ncbi:MAG: hypothetical protein JST16_07005 [Bdellovibrionales bacterium]|nr:hypothetical protein [Bdellovibrionales bacterium]